MSTIVTRSGKGSPLTHNEVDTNFTNLNTDKVEKTAAAITGGTIDNTTIGATTPSTGVFTTLGVTTSINASGAGSNVNLPLVPKGTGIVSVIPSAGWVTGQVAEINLGDNNAVLKATYATGQTALSAYNTINFATRSTLTTQMAVTHTASAVNYVQITGAATGAPSQPIISAQGSDANINIALQGKGTGSAVLLDSGGGGTLRAIPRATGGDTFLDVRRDIGGVSLLASSSVTNGSVNLISKGTGAIDLAAGSKGVNISNGGTVTAITRTAGGGSYTSTPTVVISAPTTAGGVQATATVTVSTTGTPTIVSGGTGYTVGDVLSIVGGTPVSVAATMTVTSVSGGVVTAASYTNFAQYTTPPTGTISVTGGTGSGATFNISFAVTTAFTITNAGSGYVEQPTVTFSGGGGSGAAAYATVGSATTVKTLGSTLSFSTPSGEAFRVSDLGTTPSSYWTAFGGTTAPFLRANGSSGGVVETSGTTPLLFRTNSGTEQLRVSHTASAVNYVQVTGAATGSSPTLTLQGSDANVSGVISTKGTGGFSFYTNNVNQRQLRIIHTASSVNFFDVTGGATGFGPVLAASGSDTNIPAVVQPKGTGALQAQQTDSTATGGNARGANAVDWQTSRSAASSVASGANAVVGGGASNGATGQYSGVLSGVNSNATGFATVISGGWNNSATGGQAVLVGGYSNTSGGPFNFVGGGASNSGTANAAVTTQSATMNGTTAVTLSGSNASIKVGQQIVGTSIASFTYVAAISGTSLTLSQAASGSSTSTLFFYTPHGVVVGGGNNQATGSYSFIGGGGDAGTAANRNVASGAWSVVVGGWRNTASGIASFVGGGGNYDGTTVFPNTASGNSSVVVGGINNTSSALNSFIGGGYNNIANSSQSVVIGGVGGTTRGIVANHVFAASSNPISGTIGVSQAAMLVIARETTNATATVLTSDSGSAGTSNQVILPNNSAYYFKGSVIANVTGGGNTKAWSIEGAIKRGANAASTALVGTPTVTSAYADVGAATWAIAVTADTTNGGLAVTFTGQAATTIRCVAKLETTEVTF